MSAFPRPDWDTPPDGDFASYVERLSQVQRPLPSSRTAAVRESAGPAAAAPGEVRRRAAVRPTVATPLVASATRALTLRMLRMARAGLWVLMLVQAGVLFFMGWGSMVALAVFGFLLWLVSAAASAMSVGAHQKTGDAASAAPLQSLLRVLQQGAQQHSRSPRKK